MRLKARRQAGSAASGPVNFRVVQGKESWWLPDNPLGHILNYCEPDCATITKNPDPSGNCDGCPGNCLPWTWADTWGNYQNDNFLLLLILKKQEGKHGDRTKPNSDKSAGVEHIPGRGCRGLRTIHCLSADSCTIGPDKKIQQTHVHCRCSVNTNITLPFCIGSIRAFGNNNADTAISTFLFGILDAQKLFSICGPRLAADCRILLCDVFRSDFLKEPSLCGTGSYQKKQGQLLSVSHVLNPHAIA